ncbi:hypothetical protein AaE_011450 [Aphanomyces astaci]|uniref:Helicase ATP-binding domain-containing protein n=1 Tax=Aphanomyces astaci TaxID=112090 RepID=A0A6A4ZWG3_APHAT|nr:hypothetical protein AaE_011450 [Aphanomyces astaci]
MTTSIQALLGKDMGACYSYSTMNRVQERVLPAAFKNGGNLVVSSPTGSGKTSVFEAAFLRHWSKQRQHGCEAKSGLVLYIAPLKALLHERLVDWSKRFKSLGLTFLELTDMNFDDAQSIMSHDILLSTPEKWDVLTRSSMEILGGVGLLLVDEVHHIGDGVRGATLEAVMTRMKYCSTFTFSQNEGVPLSSLRIVAASATFPNVKDIGAWLGCSPDMVFEFGPQYRPVPLELHVLGFKSFGNDFLFEKNLDQKVPDVLHKYSKGKPSLIFCSSRKASVGLAMYCTHAGQNSCVSCFTESTQEIGRGSNSIQIQNMSLKMVFQAGIGIHHAGLQENDKQLVQDLFAQGFLHILCTDHNITFSCTSSLAVGVNLPAHLVVIKSTQHYQGRSGFTEYTPMSVLQMIGRAGRPGFDKYTRILANM